MDKIYQLPEIKVLRENYFNIRKNLEKKLKTNGESVLTNISNNANCSHSNNNNNNNNKNLENENLNFVVRRLLYELEKLYIGLTKSAEDIKNVLRASQYKSSDDDISSSNTNSNNYNNVSNIASSSSLNNIKMNVTFPYFNK